jgi:L-2-hydroxyglutarate oxidase LhgO
VSWDVVVVGAGVVGLACAERLARSRRSVLVLERNGKHGQETSSRNSQVVHAGMYYPTGSLKAELCVRGNASLGAWCETRGVPLSRVGKLIVAQDEPGEAELGNILARARANGCEALDWASRAQIAEEPNVVARTALWSPRTGIIDVHALMDSLLAEARAHGCDVAFHHAIIGVSRTTSGFGLRVRDAAGEESTIEAPRVINSAGLWADEVAALAGIDVDAAGYRQHFVKGNYFRLQKRGVVSRLVYPVPPKNLAGLGVHVTVELDGAARLGPDVEPMTKPAVWGAPDYRVDEARRGRFFAAASSYLRGFREEDLSPDQSGVRPKLSRPGEPARDFVIAEESERGLPGWVNLVGIESPGMTCALEIAERVTSLLA